MVLSGLPDTLKAVADTANAGKENGGGWILHHVMDANYVDFGPLGKLYLPKIELFGIDLSITKDIFFLWACCYNISNSAFIYIKGIQKVFDSQRHNKPFRNNDNFC